MMAAPGATGAEAQTGVMMSPMVGDFDFDADPTTLHPSIVFTTITGVARVIDGATCAEQDVITDYTSARDPAIGDLDGDGRPELLLFGNAGAPGPTVIALKYAAASAEFAELWVGHDGTGARVAGGQPSIHDLNGDGVPEVIGGATVFDATGLRVIRPESETGASIGSFEPVIADVDVDGIPELVAGSGIYEPDFVNQRWERESYNTTGFGARFLAVADFGDFGDGPDAAEVVVLTTGRVAVHRITGEVVFGPRTLPGIGQGGPPTVADFDGDGEPEIGVADGASYTVFDLECMADPLPSECASTGIRWTQPSQDLSSAQTGSSVFDFEGDGAAEALYADECFLRVYDGDTGRIKFSVTRSSNTLWEYPVVADVDGDFNSEIVVGINTVALAAHACPAHDTLFEGPACTDTCPSDLHECVAGICRAPDGFADGVRVYGDRADLWVNSRPIWNQFNYHVTHVTDTGTIPATGDWLVNWLQPSLNNFRQNVIGIAGDLPAPDLTIQPRAGWVCDGASTQTFRVSVCNRGTEPVAPGVPVTFYALGVSICAGSQTATILTPGACEEVECVWTSAPTAPVDVRVVADDDAAGVDPSTECHEGNNSATVPADSCDLV
jgi:hypothetical protein